MGISVTKVADRFISLLRIFIIKRVRLDRVGYFAMRSISDENSQWLRFVRSMPNGTGHTETIKLCIGLVS